jgi:hypothetical protein
MYDLIFKKNCILHIRFKGVSKKKKRRRKEEEKKIWRYSAYCVLHFDNKRCISTNLANLTTTSTMSKPTK